MGVCVEGLIHTVTNQDRVLLFLYFAQSIHKGSKQRESSAWNFLCDIQRVCVLVK